MLIIPLSAAVKWILVYCNWKRLCFASLGAGAEEPRAGTASAESGAETGVFAGRTAAGGERSAESHRSAGRQDL